MLETIKQEFLNELNNQSALAGSYYGVADVARIINLFADRAQATITALPTQSKVDEEMILQICEIAERYAKLYVEDCAENYHYEGCVEYETHEYGGQLRVTATVDIDSSDFRSCGSFDDDGFTEKITELLNPKQEA